MKRVQRKREKGYRLPPNTLVITRGTKYGNPHKMENESEREKCIAQFARDISKALIAEFVRECEEKGIENLACFCPLDKTCHADVWIEIWEAYKNAPAPFELVGWNGKDKPLGSEINERICK